MAASPSVPTAAPPGLEAVLPLFEAHGAMWSQYFAMQAALLAPWAEWQCAWWRACKTRSCMSSAAAATGRSGSMRTSSTAW